MGSPAEEDGDRDPVQEGQDDDPVCEEAAAWVARLSSSDASAADRAAFETWRESDPSHAEAYAEMDALWRKLGQVPDPRRRRGPPRVLAGLALAAGLGAALAWQQGFADRLRADLWSPVGAVEHATLADGSRIDLNTDTALVLRFTERERRVEILRGEASFDVVPDPNRPFVVRRRSLSVRAVGTRFAVRMDGGNPVGVAEGRVDVAAADRRASVSTGEAVRLGPDDSLTVTAADVERGLAWRDGRLIFSGQPLSTVLAELGRYRHGRIVLLDSRLGERRITGAFDVGDTDDALDVIAGTMGARIRRLSSLLVLIGSPL